MNREQSRRSFLRQSMALGIGGLIAGRSVAEQSKTPYRVGVFVALNNDDPAATMALVRDVGLDLCEIYTNQVDQASAQRCREAMERHGVEASAVFTSGPGPMVWDFVDGPSTLGLVPRENRAARVSALKQASDFARICGAPAFETHVGFLPENPKDPLYAETVEAVRDVAAYCQANGQTFLYHAGQETPITLMRMIRDVGLDNQGVGLDTANLILCGKGHPCDALEAYGDQLKAVNVKDGLYPSDPARFGRETALGEGRVGFPRFFRRLKRIGYTGPIIIEREDAGDSFPNEIRKAHSFLKSIW